MSFLLSFPFCGISDFGTPKHITGTVTVTSTTHGISVTKTVALDSMPWSDNHPNEKVELYINQELFTDKPLEVTITATVNEPNYLFLFFKPTVTTTNNLHYDIFSTEGCWTNVPVASNALTKHQFTVVAYETVDSIIGELADSVTYRDTLTYTDPGSTSADIEQYLGKDRFKNLFFSNKIPTAWDIPARVKNLTSDNFFNKTIIHPDGIEYTYNNLGYRSSFDYNIETLTTTKNIVCLGDSDLFGAGINYNDLWSTQLQNLLGNDYTVLNMGIQGASADALARIGVSIMSSIPVTAVLVHWPHTSLREFVSKTYKGGVHTHRNYDLPYEDWWKHIDWHSNNYNYNKNKILLENTATRYDVQYADLYINRDDPNVPYDFVEFGIYSCIGPHTHRAIANYFNRKINNQPSLFESTQL